MIVQRRSIFDDLLLEMVIPWLISMNWLWALGLIRRIWNQESEAVVALVSDPVSPVEAPAPVTLR